MPTSFGRLAVPLAQRFQRPGFEDAMAVWQFDMHMLPTQALDQAAELSAEACDSTDWWRNFQPPPDYAEHIEQMLPRARSWSPEIDIWGSDDGHRVDIVRENGRVADIFVRIDLRTPHSDFASALASLATTWSCALRVAETGAFLGPAPTDILRAIAASSAAEFVSDPRGYIGRLARK